MISIRSHNSLPKTALCILFPYLLGIFNIFQFGLKYNIEAAPSVGRYWPPGGFGQNCSTITNDVMLTFYAGSQKSTGKKADGKYFNDKQKHEGEYVVAVPKARSPNVAQRMVFVSQVCPIMRMG